MNETINQRSNWVVAWCYLKDNFIEYIHKVTFIKDPKPLTLGET